MRPLGLDGVVGAPAIVRENPLFAAYDRFAATYNVRLLVRIDYRQTLIHAWPFTWHDVLGVVQERYAGATDTKLQEFINQSSQIIPDPVLTYDLDTPDLDITFRRQAPEGIVWPQHLVSYDPSTRRLVALPPDQVSAGTALGSPYDLGRVVRLRGTCRVFRVNGATALIDGDARHVIVEDGLCVVRGRVTGVSFRSQSVCGILPEARVEGTLYTSGLVLSAIPLIYEAHEHKVQGVVCGPADDDRIHALYRSFTAMADNPDALLLSTPRLRSRAARATDRARKRQRQRQMDGTDPQVIPSYTLGGGKYQFTPRGAQ